MAPSNLTDLHNAKGVYDLIKFSNDNTGGAVGIFFTICVFLISFLIVKFTKHTFEESLLAASFVGFGFSIGMVAMQLLDWQWIVGFIILMAFDAYYIYQNRSPY